MADNSTQSTAAQDVRVSRASEGADDAYLDGLDAEEEDDADAPPSGFVPRGAPSRPVAAKPKPR
ncbi:hypothetical protein OF83DRAFT_1174248 [Amylostereum chailletii]|nr:hypothetical protein OF83DRAFT_1174248 [Amylostereum chailletii]